MLENFTKLYKKAVILYKIAPKNTKITRFWP